MAAASDCNLWNLLAATASAQGTRGRPAIVVDDLRLDYAELARRVAGLANSLRARGITPGERVAILSRNRAEFLECYFAVAAIGAILVPCNTRLTIAEHAAVIDDSGARLMIAERAFANVVTALPVEVCWIDPASWPSAVPVLDEFEACRKGASDVAQLYYTSGTTGTPKGVMLTHGNVRAHAAMAVAELALGPTDTWGHIAPMFHLADAWATFAITAVGGCHTFLAEFSAQRALELIARERITISNLVPTMLTHMVAAPLASTSQLGDTTSLRAILSGGAPIAPETVAAIVARFRCEYVQTYGMTETSPFLTMSLLDEQLRALPADEQLRWRAKTGRPVRGIELRVIGQDGRPVPADERTVGEIQVRGATVTPGYWRRDDATRAAFTDDGFLHTGDLAVVDHKGFVTIVDRAKDVILTGGETVYSVEIENRLYEHPAVLECAVVGLPDPNWGERVVAFVVLRQHADTTAERLITFCRANLAGFKTPKEVRFLDALPRTGSGKIAKRQLR